MVTRYLKLSVLVFLSFFLSTCKKDDGGTPVNGAMFEVFQTINNTRDKFYENGRDRNGNYKEAIVLTGQWLETQPGIESVVYEDSTNIYITLTSGKKTYFSVIETDAQGNSKFRGGGGGGPLKRMPLTGSCPHKIENKKVLLFAAAYKDFYQNDPASLQRVVDLFEDADPDFEVTVLKNEQCTPQLVETFGNYGFVSLETHGSPESFLSGVKLDVADPPSITNEAQLTSYISTTLGQNYAQLFTDGKIVLGSVDELDPLNTGWWQSGIAGTFLEREYSVSISSLYIESLPPTPNTVILGNMCYSGYGAMGNCRNPGSGHYTHPIRRAFETLDPISYYCYAFSNETSTQVLDADAKVMLWELSQSLLNDGDSTGNAHLTDIGTFREAGVNFPILITQCQSQFYFKHFGKTDYCYGGCPDTLVDGRDGQVYKVLCMGDQVWMAENLNWAGTGECYDGNAANCDTYGRLYSIQELTGATYSETNPSGVQGVCPPGWHVPSQAEYQEMIDFTGEHISDAADLFRSTNLWPAGEEGTDAYGFKILPGGYVGIGNTWHEYRELGEKAYLWTSSSSSPNTPKTVAVAPGGMGFMGYQVQPNPPITDWKFSCRCVKD